MIPTVAITYISGVVRGISVGKATLRLLPDAQNRTWICRVRAFIFEGKPGLRLAGKPGFRFRWGALNSDIGHKMKALRAAAS